MQKSDSRHSDADAEHTVALSTAKQELDEQTAAVKMLECQLTELTQAKGDLTQQLETRVQELEQQRHQYAQLETQHSEVESCCSDLQNQLKQAAEQSATQMDDLHSLDSQNAALKQSEANLQEKLGQRAQQAEQAQREHDEQLSHAEDLQKQLSASSAVQQEIRAELDSTAAALSSQRQAYSGLVPSQCVCFECRTCTAGWHDFAAHVTIMIMNAIDQQASLLILRCM